MAPTPESPPESPTDLVLVKNFSLPDAAPARMTRESFELSFRANGFELVDDNGDRIKPQTPKAKIGGVLA